jgi:hypothetical protein
MCRLKKPRKNLRVSVAIFKAPKGWVLGQELIHLGNPDGGPNVQSIQVEQKEFPP